MKKLLRWLVIGALAAGLHSVAHAQLYPKFGPVTGVLKGSVSTPQTSAAVASDLTSLFSCTADTSHFLNGAGTCTIPPGTGVTSVGASFAGAWYTVSGSPVTSAGTLAFGLTTGLTAKSFLATPTGTTGTLSLRTIALGDLPTINVAGGGTGLATLPAHGVLLGEGTGNVGNVAAMPVDTFLQGQGAGADPAGLAIGNCAGTNQALTYSTSLHSFLCSTVVGFGTPTSLVSLTAHTGSSINSMAADSSPALDQTIVPTWTAQHIFTKNFTTGGLAGDAPIFLKSAQPGTIMDATGQATDAKLWNNVVAGLDWLLQGVNDAGTVSRNAIDITRVAASPAIATIALGNATDNPTITGNGVNVTPQSGSFTATGTGFTTSPSGTATYLVIGKTAFLFMPAISATSNATTFTITGLPANLRPAAIGFQEGIVSLTDNGAESFGQATFAAGSGTITMEKNGSSTGFTASGSKGFGLQIITYSLN